jgi:hypothetical protein
MMYTPSPTPALTCHYHTEPHSGRVDHGFPIALPERSSSRGIAYAAPELLASLNMTFGYGLTSHQSWAANGPAEVINLLPPASGTKRA